MDTYWICIQTFSRSEFQVETDLDRAGYEVYLPRKWIDMRTRRHRKVITEPLYASYMFVQALDGLDGTDLHPIKSHRRVCRIVRSGDHPAKAPDSLIQFLKSKENPEGVHMTKHQYEQGDHVRMKTGLLKEYEAQVVSLSRGERAIIRELSTGKEIDVKLSDLEPVS